MELVDSVQKVEEIEGGICTRPSVQGKICALSTETIYISLFLPHDQASI
jgi:hypothetical protein